MAAGTASDAATTPTPGTFAEFYAAYLEAHRNPWNRALHLFAKVAMLALVALAITRREPLWILLVPIAGVLPCWLGHLLLEGNRPTSWTRPAASLLGAVRKIVAPRDAGRERPRERRYWSFLADLRMCAAMLGLQAGKPAGSASKTGARSSPER